MRVVLVLLCRVLLMSCGGGKRESQVTRSVALLPARASTEVPRFGDTDPHDWSGSTPAHYPVHGIDVSKYQGDIDWHRVRASGVGFAFIKATEGGDHADERFAENWAARAGAAGMPRGAYHYYYFCRPALEQAAWFIEPRPQATPRRCRRCSTSSGRTSRGPAPTAPTPTTVRSEARAFLQVAAAPLRQAPGDLHHRRLLPRQRALAASKAIRSGCARSPAIPRRSIPTSAGPSGNTPAPASSTASTARPTSTSSPAPSARC